MYISTIHSLENLEKLKEAGIDAVIIGVPYYSIRHCIEATSAVIATALKICPVLNVNCEGKLIPRQKIRKKSRAIEGLAKMFMEHAEDGAAYTGKCSISHSLCREDAEAVAALIEQEAPALKGKIRISDIGTVIGSHTGPGTVALFFMGDTVGE